MTESVGRVVNTSSSEAVSEERSSSDDPAKARLSAAITPRSILIAALLIPVLVFWVEYTESVANGPDLAAMSLPMASTFALMLLCGINIGLKRSFPKAALSQIELLTIYSMCTLAVYIGGIGMIQFLHPTLVGWRYFATPYNGWDKWFHFVRAWAVPNTDVVAAYYRGHSSFFTTANFSGWIVAIVVWSLFLFTLLFCLYCIAAIVRKQWVESERLTFPIVQIPFEMTRNGGSTPLWTNPTFWTGALIPIVLETLATLHFTLSPTVPYLPIKPGPLLDIGKYLTTPPWDGVGGLTLSFYPLVIGLTYFLALDVSFSCWFFYLFVKLEAVACIVFGFRAPGASPAAALMPYSAEQGFGAFIGLAIFSIWLGRSHLRGVWRCAFNNDRTVSDKDEPLSYRVALLGMMISAALLVAFGVALGLSLLTSVIFFALFFILALAFVRIRAEAGLPWAMGPQGLAHGAMVNMGGTEAYTPQELTTLSFMQWFDSDWRCQPQTIELESMKMMSGAEQKAYNPRQLTAALGVAAVVGIFAAWFCCLGIYYHYGASSAILNPWRTDIGHYQFDALQGQLLTPTPMDNSRLGATLVGVAAVMALSALRVRFAWWPLHPIGYAIGNTETMGWMWFAVFTGWLAKSLILRFGGISVYRRALPFFLGLILGDYAISGLWSLYFVLSGQPGYRTFPI